MTKPVLSVDTKDGRRYAHPITGELVPSVTTVIHAGIPQPWMGPWAAKMSAEHAVANWLRLSSMPHVDRVMEIKNAHKIYAEKAANIGDIVHNLVECWSTGQPFPNPPKEIDGFINQFIAFLTERQPRFIENEVTLWSRTHGYAGTCDFIMRVGNKTYLADLKTGRRLHTEIGLQLSALAHADFIVRPDGKEEQLPHIDGLAGLHVRPRSWKLVEVPDISFDAFLAARDIMRWTVETAPKVLP